MEWTWTRSKLRPALPGACRGVGHPLLSASPKEGGEIGGGGGGGEREQERLARAGEHWHIIRQGVHMQGRCSACERQQCGRSVIVRIMSRVRQALRKRLGSPGSGPGHVGGAPSKQCEGDTKY